jgi:hypothetical protein
MFGTGLAIGAMAVANAGAGTISEGTWESAPCGEKPSLAPVVLSSPEAFNKGRAPANAYRRATRDYLECLVQEGNTDMQSITRVINSERDRAAEANPKILENASAAEARFDKGKAGSN